MRKFIGIILLCAAIVAAPAVQAVELTELQAPGALPGERFGFDVAACDGLMAVGRPHDGADGSVAIFEDGDIVDEVFYPGASSGGAEFGHTVALSSDCQVLAVGAPYTSDTYGIAFVFERSVNGLFVLMQALPAPAPTEGDQAGQAIAVSSDGDTVAVGAHPNGRVYIWDRQPGGFYEVKELSFSDWYPLDYIGYSLAFAGNNRLIVTAPLDTPVSGQTYSGSFYVFGRHQGGTNNWGELSKQNTPGVFRVGWSVSASGRRFAVGGWGPQGPTNNGGEVYVYTLSASGQPTLEQKVISPMLEMDATFGNDVALVGDHLLVGEPLRDNNAPNRGAWNLFRRTGSGAQPWAPVYVAQTPTEALGTQYGFSVATYGGTHLVGAPFSEIYGSQAGWAGFLEHSAIFADGFETGATDQWRLASD